MRALLFGATGMIGQGVLRECLENSAVASVLAVARGPTGRSHAKLREVVARDLSDLSSIEPHLAGFDACFLCLGVSAVGLSEDRYAEITHDLTLSIARTVVRLNPRITLTYVSGQGADASERGRTMWARVKGRTENALLALSPTSYMFRPGLIVPMHGIRSRTVWYNAVYALLSPMLPLLQRFFPGSVTTTERLGAAMISVARDGASRRVLETSDINRIAAAL